VCFANINELEIPLNFLFCYRRKLFKETRRFYWT
jgi:hypothetical protein